MANLTPQLKLEAIYEKRNSPKFEIVIYWDNDDQIFVAEVPELPRCIAYGKTQVEAVQNVGEAIELRLETAALSDKHTQIL